MKRDLVLLFLFLLCFDSIYTDSVEDCSGFEDIKTQKCQDLSINSGKKCYYDGQQCKEWYQDCSDYTPSGNTDTTCAKIIPSKETNDKYKKCVVKDNTCQKIYKTCEDLSNDECTNYSSSNLNLGIGERCVLFNNKCKLHYNSCTDTHLNEDQKCKDNIPSNNAKRCNWDGSSCKEDNRKCEDYIEYFSYGETYQQCHLLAHTSPKICYYDGNNCIETYKSCEDLHPSDTKTICTNILPLNEYPSSSGIYLRDYLKKCVSEESGCKTKPKTCKDYKKEEDDEAPCSSLQSEKGETNVKAYCVLQEDSCVDLYMRCEDYNDLVTDPTKRNSTECTSIIPSNIDTGNIEIDDHYKCSFKEDDNNKCVTIKKTCTEIKKESTCNSHALSDTKKKCIFKEDKCIEEFKNCDEYNSSDKSKMTQNDCESITPIYTDGKVYKCVYKEIDSIKSCEKQELTKCEDYLGDNEDICKSYPVNDTDLYTCVFVDNHCVTQYKRCSIYNEQILYYGKKAYKTICESIVSDNYGKYRCFLENDKTCTKDVKICSDYKEEDGYECQDYRATGTGKVCALENGKCVEKYQTENYYYCSDYRGTDREFCESIQPYNSFSYSPDFSSKCVYGNKGCEKLPKKCEEAKDQTECQKIVPSNTDKMCIFREKCVEQYKTCDLYQTKENTLDKTTCESILIENKADTYKCVFTAGSGSSKGTCREETRKCTDFKIESIQAQCSNINFSTKKCTFSNNGCSLIDKTCLDLYSSSSVDEEICAAAPTSSNNKKCIENPNGNGCREVDKTEENKNNEQGENSGSFIGKYFLEMLILIFLSL